MIAKNFTQSQITNRLEEEINWRVHILDCNAKEWSLEELRAFAVESLGVATAYAFATGDNDRSMEFKREIREMLARCEARKGCRCRPLPRTVYQCPPTA